MTSKICMDPDCVVPGKFGDTTLFDRPLQYDLGFMDAVPLRGIFLEHVIAADALVPFSPTNHPELKCTPKGELYYVMGEEGFDPKTSLLNLDAMPTYGESDMVEGRNTKSLAELMRVSEVDRAGLLPEEVVALEKNVCHSSRGHSMLWLPM